MAADSNPTNPYAEDDLLVRADAAAVRSRAARDNPYAAPDVHLVKVDDLSPEPAVANEEGLIGPWRDGELLVVNRPGRLPACCLKCGCTTEEMENLQLVPFKPQKADGGWVTASLCPACFGLHRRGEFDLIIGSCGLIAAPIIMAYLLVQFPFSRGTLPAFVIAGPFAMVISFVVIWLATQRIATLTEVAVRGDNHWLRGAKPAFLDRLPLFPRK